MKLKFLFYITFFIYSSTSKAQTFAWASKAGGKGTDEGTFICVDKSGNTYVAGYYMDTATFGSNVFSCIGGSYDSNIFLAKYDPSGNLLWARSAGGPTGDEPRGLVCDKSGNIYLCGVFSSTASFGGHNLTCTTGLGMFLAKYDGSGNCYSAQQIMTSGGAIVGMCIDKNDELYFTGSYTGTIYFGTFILIGTNYGGIEKETGYIAKYTNSGSVIWANKIVNPEDRLSGYAISTDSLGNPYVVGEYSNSSGAIFYSPSNTISLTEPQGIFTAKYDAGGTVIWATSSSGIGGTAYGIKTDSAGNSYITGSFQGTTSFGSYTFTASGLVDIFVVKYSPSGSIQWARKAGGPQQSRGSSIALDKNSNCYITGIFTTSVLFSDGTTSYTLSAAPVYSHQVFMAKYLANGSLSWATQTISYNGQNEGLGIAIDHDNDVLVTGGYKRTTDFGGYSLFADYYSSGFSEIFVAKIDQQLLEVKELMANSQLLVYPNPSNNIINIQYSSSEKNNLLITIINASGQTVYIDSLEGFTGKYQKNIDLGRFAKGLYNIQIINGKKQEVKKFVLN